MGTLSPLPVPKYYDPQQARSWAYRPDLSEVFAAAEDARKRHGVKPAATARTRIHVVGIDVQKDFCFPDGTLYVGGRSGTGAMDDSARFAEFLYRNAALITGTTMTMDTHFAFQIFFASFWVDEEGRALTAHTLVDLDQNGRLINTDLAGKTLHENIRPNPALAAWLTNGDYAWLLNQALFYCAELKRGGKYALYLWPFHCVLGTDGHALVGAISAARMYLAFLRATQSNTEVKGGNPLTENYSVFQPEVLGRWDAKGSLGQRNASFIEKLLKEDVVVFAGQAASHCVKSSIDDFLSEIMAQDPALARKIYILEDCMSAVAVPDGKGGFLADFTPQAEEALRKFRDAGMHVVRSTDPIASWPGVTL